MRKQSTFNQNKYIQEYQSEHYTRITILIKKEDDLLSRLKLYCRKHKTTISKIGYDAINEYLEKYDNDAE